MKLFKSGWYIGYTKPNHERKAELDLIKKSIGCFLPSIKILSLRKDRKKYVNAPLFPSYIFIYLNSYKEYYSALNSMSIVKFLKNGNDVARLDDQIIENIRISILSGKGIEISQRSFIEGEKIVLAYGPFMGKECEFVRLGSENRMIVRLDLLGRSLLIHLDYNSSISNVG